jgi:predicted SAM-dependent methyltransferase
MSGIRLHIGGQEVKAGWKILDPVARPETDMIGTAQNLSFLADDSCAEIYASHVLEHLGYDGELQATLKGFHRVLAPGGRLRVSVPDMDTLCRLFHHPNVTVDGKFQVMRMLFGGRQDAFDVHLSGLNFDFLGNFLTQAGFQGIKRVAEFHEFVDDGANFRFLGVPVSCNIEAFKGA